VSTEPTDRQPLPLPIWARLADAVTVAGLVLGVAVAASGGFRWRVGDTRVSLTSAPRILLAVLVLGLIRHLLVRRAPLYARLVTGARHARRSEALRAVLPLWLTSRLVVLAVGFLAVAAVGFPMAKAPFRVYHNELLNLPARLDTGWYFSITGRPADGKAPGVCSKILQVTCKAMVTMPTTNLAHPEKLPTWPAGHTPAESSNMP